MERYVSTQYRVNTKNEKLIYEINKMDYSIDMYMLSKWMCKGNKHILYNQYNNQCKWNRY